MLSRSLFLAAALVIQTSGVCAQIAVSANDGKQHAAGRPDEALVPDSIAVIDIGHVPVRTLAKLYVPASLVGPPASVAVARDSSFAIVTAAQQLNGSHTVPADTVSVIDLTDPTKPRLVQTLHAGAGASGVAINPNATLALVANAGADSISAFRIEAHRLTPSGTIQLEAKSKPLDIGFSADGRTAYVVAQGAGTLVRLAVDGTHLTHVGKDIRLGVQPYSLSVNQTTRIAYVSNLGGRAPTAASDAKLGTVAVVDLAAGKMVAQVDAGTTPEHIALSPDGRYLEANMVNGSSANPNSPMYHAHGTMIIYRVNGKTLVPAARTDTGRWCQGAAWSGDGGRVLLQCAAARQIEVYNFDGRHLVPNPAAGVQLDARPGAIATALSR